MMTRLGFVTVASDALPSGDAAETMNWIASQCRKVAEEHTALAERAESLMNSFDGHRHFDTELRSFARYHRRAARADLEMAHRAEAAIRSGFDEFDLADVA
jgi:hypothetical protein